MDIFTDSEISAKAVSFMRDAINDLEGSCSYKYSASKVCHNVAEKLEALSKLCDE